MAFPVRTSAASPAPPPPRQPAAAKSRSQSQKESSHAQPRARTHQEAVLESDLCSRLTDPLRRRKPSGPGTAAIGRELIRYAQPTVLARPVRPPDCVLREPSHKIQLPPSPRVIGPARSGDLVTRLRRRPRPQSPAPSPRRVPAKESNQRPTDHQHQRNHPCGFHSESPWSISRAGQGPVRPVRVRCVSAPRRWIQFDRCGPPHTHGASSTTRTASFCQPESPYLPLPFQLTTENWELTTALKADEEKRMRPVWPIRFSSIVLNFDLCGLALFRRGHRPQNQAIGFRPHMSSPDADERGTRNYNKRIDQCCLHSDFSFVVTSVSLGSRRVGIARTKTLENVWVTPDKSGYSLTID